MRFFDLRYLVQMEQLTKTNAIMDNRENARKVLRLGVGEDSHFVEGLDWGKPLFKG